MKPSVRKRFTPVLTVEQPRRALKVLLRYRCDEHQQEDERNQNDPDREPRSQARRLSCVVVVVVPPVIQPRAWNAGAAVDATMRRDARAQPTQAGAEADAALSEIDCQRSESVEFA